MRLERLIGIALISLACVYGMDNVLTRQEKANGWILLFDGKTLNGWDSDARAAPGRGAGAGAQTRAVPPPGAVAQTGSNPRPCSTPVGKAPVPEGASHWEVINGLLEPCGEAAGYLTSKENYRNFVLDVDFKTAEDTNSGIFVHSPDGTLGYEVQIWKQQPQGYNTGSIVGTGKTDRQYNFLADKWNHFEITVEGDHLVIVLNGTRTLDVHDSKFPDGRIRLQYQKFPIEFKNIKLRLLNQ
jgi:hypothetical protein